MLQLKAVRERKGLTQDALARISGVSVRTIWRAETLGTGSYTTVMALSQALGVPVEELFEENGK